jgi:hypothetical protein
LTINPDDELRIVKESGRQNLANSIRIRKVALDYDS